MHVHPVAHNNVLSLQLPIYSLKGAAPYSVESVICAGQCYDLHMRGEWGCVCVYVRVCV